MTDRNMPDVADVDVDIAKRPPEMDKHYRSLVVGPASELYERAMHLEYEVFLASGYCEADPRGFVAEYDDWADDSAFAVVRDSQDGELVGTVRILTGPYRSLPIGAFERTVDYPGDPVCEYVATAVAPHVRARGVAEELWRLVWVHARRVGVEGLVGLVDPWLHERLRDYYGFPFRALGQSRWYMGGDVRPIGVDIFSLEHAVMADRPDLYAWLTEAWTIDEMIELQIPMTEQVIDLRTISSDARAVSQEN